MSSNIEHMQLLHQAVGMDFGRLSHCDGCVVVDACHSYVPSSGGAQGLKLVPGDAAPPLCNATFYTQVCICTEN